MGPAPIIKALSPFFIFKSCMPCMTHDSGSRNAASSNVRFLGLRNTFCFTICSGSRIYSANAPRTLVSIIFSQILKRPFLQYLHLRQGALWTAIISLPFLNFFTPLPVAAITPENSCPKTPGIGIIWWPLLKALRSVPQVSAALIFTRISPREGSGTFNSRISILRGLTRILAFKI